MKVLLTLLVLCLSFETITSTCRRVTCRKRKLMCYNYTACSPLLYAGNVGSFNLYLREEKSDWFKDAKKYSKYKKKFKEINNDLYNFSASFYEEEKEYHSNIKKRGKSYLKEIEKEFNNGKERYTELEEFKEEFSHIVEGGKSSTKEYEISGEGVVGKLMALSAGMDQDPKTMGKLINDNPADAKQALLLFNPVCNSSCGRRKIILFSVWNWVFGRCWNYFLTQQIYGFPCWKRRMLLRKFLRALCRARGFSRRLIRFILGYWRYHTKPTICSWRKY